MKISKKGLLAAGGFFASTGAVFAQTSSSASTFLPPALQALFDLLGVGGSGTATFVTDRVQFAIYMVLGLIILVAVFYSIMAGIKYIRSEGDPGKIEEAQKSIKAILMGIAAIFVGILGIILVYVIFNQNITPSSLPQVCISAGSSVGCTQYNQHGIDNEVVQWCEGVYKAVSTKKQDGTARFPDGITSLSAGGIANMAEGTGFVKPAGPLDIFDPASTGNTPIDIASLTATQAVWLCIDPLKGGYLPVQQ